MVDDFDHGKDRVGQRRRPPKLTTSETLSRVAELARVPNVPTGRRHAGLKRGATDIGSLRDEDGLHVLLL
jgi:hypothetical protein